MTMWSVADGVGRASPGRSCPVRRIAVNQKLRRNLMQGGPGGRRPPGVVGFPCQDDRGRSGPTMAAFFWAARFCFRQPLPKVPHQAGLFLPQRQVRPAVCTEVPIVSNGAADGTAAWAAVSMNVAEIAAARAET